VFALLNLSRYNASQQRGENVSRLTLLLLGSPRIERDGKPIKVDTRKAIALIAHLAVTRTPQSRDALAALLWPDHDQTGARGALRRTLSALKKALDGEWLDVNRQSLALQRGAGLRIDVEEFRDRLDRVRTHRHPRIERCAACIERLTEGVGLYREDFMAGFALRDSPDFDDWQFFQAERLRLELSGALEQLVEVHMARHEWGLATEHGRRWLMLDPMHEPAHRQLMLAYTWAGQRTAALRQYRECVRILQLELGVPPLKETTTLYERIREHAPPPAPAAIHEPGGGGTRWNPPPADAPPRGVAPRPVDLPLIGRAEQWAAMLGVYNAIRADGALLALEGEAGIGKTRLAEEFLAHVRSVGAITFAVRCFEGETNLAYGPLTPALRDAVARADAAGRLGSILPHLLAEVARLLPDIATLRPDLPAPPPLDSPGAQSRFFEGISQTLLAAAGGERTGVLCFEDLHWADTASLDLLTYLVRRLSGHRVCVLMTWRTEQVPPGHRLRALLAEQGRAGAVRVLALPRLSRAAVLELVATLPDLPPATSERVYGETEGLPFFLVEYLAVLAQHADGTEQRDWALPGGVRDLLHSRLSAVSDAGWQLLTTAAVIGRSFDFDTLREASGRGEEETIAGLESLVSRGFVREVPSGGGDGRFVYLFGHEKLREVVYHEMSLARRRLLHRRVAEALVGRSRGQSDAQRDIAGLVAAHYKLAGQDAESAAYYKLAGDRSRALYANAEALAHFGSALALGHPKAADLHEAIGDMHTLLGEYGRALESYQAAAAISGTEALPGLERKLGDVYHRRGELEPAERHFEAALAALPTENAAAERAGLHADWSLVAHQGGDTPRAVELARRARELAEAAGDVRSLAQTHNLLGILAGSQGDHRTARHYLEHSLALAQTLDDPGARVAALNNLALTSRAGGNVRRALELEEEALALCAAQGDRHREAALHNNLADILHATGQRGAAMAHLKRAVTIYAEIGVEAGTVRPEVWKLTEW